MPDLIEILAERLSPAELETVLHEVHAQRVSRMTPAGVLASYEQDQHVRPPQAGAATLATIDQAALAAAVPPFEPLDLSPICPLGTVAALAPGERDAACIAGGSSEVVSDCMAALTLEAALRRHTAERDVTVRLCTSQRELRALFASVPWQEPHARAFALCTAGLEASGMRFEGGSLREQIEVHLRLLQSLRQQGFGIEAVRVALAPEPGIALTEFLGIDVIAPLTAAFPDVRFVIDGAPARYFVPIGFTILAEDAAGVEHPIGLGGCADWTRRLLGRDDERLVVSRIATERVGEAFPSHNSRTAQSPPVPR